MKEEESCCSSSLNQNCCQPDSSTGVEDAVKKTYGQLWTNQKKSGANRLASLPSAHEALLGELKLRKGMKVLDIGSGSGETVLTIAKKVGSTGKAVGVDFSPQGVALATQKARQQKLDHITEFHQANAQELPFPDNTFDAVISECVVCLIQDKQKTLNEKVRVLKPGGRVVMHDVVTWAPMPKAVRENQKLYCNCVGGAVSLDEYVKMMKKAGLTDIRTVDFTRDAKKMTNVDVAEALHLEDSDASREITEFARKGSIGYALLTGTKKQA